MTVANTARTRYAAFETYIVSRRTPDVLVAMRRLQEGWPVQTRRQYAERLIKTLSLVLVGNPLVYGLLARGCEKAGRDLDDVVNGVVRAFPGEGSEGRPTSAPSAAPSTARPRGTWRSSTAGKAGTFSATPRASRTRSRGCIPRARTSGRRSTMPPTRSGR